MAFFEEQGIYFPPAGRVWNGGHHNIAWELNGDAGFDPGLGTLEALEKEIAESPCPHVLLSSEDFEFWYARPDLLERIKAVAERTGYVVEVVLVIRPAAKYVESLYKELRKHGLTVTKDEFLATIIREGHYPFKERDYYFDYPAMVQGFAAVFGAEHVWVLPYNSSDSNRPFFQALSKLTGRTIVGVEIWQRMNPRIAPWHYRLRHPIKTWKRHDFTPDELARIEAKFPTPISALTRVP